MTDLDTETRQLQIKTLRGFAVHSSATSASTEGTPFLTLTAIRHQNPGCGHTVFLGPWCKTVPGPVNPQLESGEFLPDIWSDRAKLASAYDSVQEICERLLRELSGGLNRVHQVEHGLRFWRILIGPWLYWYAGVMFDRLATMRAAIERYPEFSTVGLAADCFVVPRDTLEFSSLIVEDGYNLQLFTRILEFLGYDVPRERVQLIPAELDRKQPRKGVGYALGRLMLRLLPADLIWKATYFPRNVEFKLMWMLPGKAKRVAPEPFRPASCPPDRNRRALLRDALSGGSEFEDLIRYALPLDLPLCFLEQFAAVAGEVERSYPSPPKAIFSATDWYYDEPFKLWTASAAEQGTILLGTQHGTNYGGTIHLLSEQHETEVVDRYYSWGWESSGHACEITPMPAARFCGRESLGTAPPAETAILFGLTCGPRYLVELSYAPQQFSSYLDWQRRFVRHLTPETASKLRVRPHHQDLGWGVRSWWQQEFPKIALEDWSMTFMESLRHCRLYVCDHCSTTFGEALAANKPTILFWVPAECELRPSAQPYYDRLRHAGILFDSPESAADAVSAVYDRVEEWWNQPELQSARFDFCQRFARTSTTAVQEWARELRRVARGGVAERSSSGNRQ